jgi:hypothetical protein
MRLFFKKTLIFLSFVFVAATGLQLALDFRVRGKMTNSEDNLDITNRSNADIVFLGNSRCLQHFDPHFFDTTFHLNSVNIGVTGHSEITLAMIRLKNYLSTNKSPRFVVLNFDPTVTSGSFTNDSSLFQKHLFARFAYMPSKKNSPFVDYFRFNSFEKLVPLYAIFKYDRLKDYVNIGYTSPYVKYGYDRKDEHWDTIAHPANDSIKNIYATDSQMQAISLMLDSLNKMCIANHAKLICIQTPLYKSLWDEAAFARTKKMADGLNIPFIDANTRTIAENVENFHDVDHLNTTGVKELNAFLATDSTLRSLLN